MLASSNGYKEIVRVLAEAKADPNITNKVKLHYIHYCIVQTRSRSCISLQDGDTALIKAFSGSRWGHGLTDIVKILVDLGADVNCRNKVSDSKAIA